jgi:hypothetical protein
VADVRYFDIVGLPHGGHRIYYEAPLPDGSHEVRTELVPGAGAEAGLDGTTAGVA